MPDLDNPYLEDEETRALEEFLHDAGLGESSIEKLDPPFPDFRVSFANHKKVYVELTSWHQGGNSPKGAEGRKFESQWWRLMKLIVEHLEQDEDKARLQHVSGLLFTKKQRLPPERQLAALAKELVDCTRANLDRIMTESKVTIAHFGVGSLSDLYIRHLTLRNANTAIIMYWSCGNVSTAWVGITPDQLDTVIDPKAGKSPSYRSQVGDSELWLLIYAMDWTASTFAPRAYRIQQVAVDQQAKLARTGFDQIWFHGRVCGDAVRIFPDPRIIRSGIELDTGALECET